MVNPAVQPTDRTIASMMLLHLKPLKRLFTWTNLKTAAMLENINALWRSNIPVGISHTQKKRLNMAFQNTNCQNTHINNKKKGCNVSPTQKGANSQNCSHSFRLDQRCFSQTTRECGESGKGPPFFFLCWFWNEEDQECTNASVFLKMWDLKIFKPVIHLDSSVNRHRHKINKSVVGLWFWD